MSSDPRPPLLFAAVADDDTGASDLAGMLAERGVPTLLVIDLPAPEQFSEWGRGYAAVVMAEGTRNVAPAAAYERTRAAVRLLRARRPRLFQIKYCSTFDSTPEGNIGPAIDAALDELGEAFTVAVPALPVNGRTTYQGYHFVHGRLLSDSPMRHHPLTPMTNPDLVDLLARQTRRKVGLAPHAAVEAGAEALGEHFRRLRAEGVAVAVVDCLHDVHLQTICRAAADLRLVTGSSAFGMFLPDLWRERGLLAESVGAPLPSPEASAPGAGCLVVAGSCSEATRRQNERFAAGGAAVHKLSATDLIAGAPDLAALARQLRGELAAGRHSLLTTSAGAEEVRRAQEWGAGRGLSVPAVGEAVSQALADLVLAVLEGGTAGGLLVAGGETSGAVCRRLGLGALRVGKNIEPGVPVCFALGRFRLPVVLKSGNFGGEDFYGKALRALARPAEFFV
ncbi:MAG TPA: 3-oxo-tetronate kinase [Pyrinomonadaceae bacterium]|nr:3-oxo-tetronate kinase [Pyrinomonadaceae bacterium]